MPGDLPGVVALLLRLILAWQVVWGLVAFVAMWRDKGLAAEGQGRTRTPERELHALEARGGWLGSWLAQRAFRHKTRKVAYQRVFRRIALAWALADVLIVAGLILLPAIFN
ncbi:DUF1294 domain-containing protein [Deinococcus actinosclerus]|uniref:DUF1294 domain-containing protein n=1 Tax=Deinococcus actinosclerus TaxID=1768108 RepID=A0ABM5X575_9DEIO|nr:DUF1294 domain-containing protein [Deinococcus actinosclerus]ALW88925.1 hypothetical protein AUC44_08505 [Deinococcus actinosclerus]